MRFYIIRIYLCSCAEGYVWYVYSYPSMGQSSHEIELKLRFDDAGIEIAGLVEELLNDADVAAWVVDRMATPAQVDLDGAAGG